jgi:guanylate kinase
MPSESMKRLGILFVISAPSGAGKSTICSSLRQTPDTVYAVSCTTREPRAGETNGEDYHFMDASEFEQRIAAGEFLEYARVHDRYYGTLRQTIIDSLREGIDVLVDIDVQGADTIRQSKDSFIQDSLVDIFIMPPNLDELRHRLVKRGTETAEQIEHRLTNTGTPSSAGRWRRICRNSAPSPGPSATSAGASFR